MNAKELSEYIAKRPGITNDQVCSNLKHRGIRAADVNAARALKGGGKKAEVTDSPPATVQKIRARDISEFRKAHDIPQKIRDRLATMRAASYVTEEELRQLCDVAVANWRRNADLPEFSEHKFKLDGITYWGPVATIKEMKKITGRA